MAPMSERFELRLDEDTITRIDEWRTTQTDLPSRAEAMRRLVEIGLQGKESDAIKISDGEKLLLCMMQDLYKHLKVPKDFGTDTDFIAEVIYGGHYWAPKWKMPGIFHGHEDKPQNVRFVMNVLDMWSRLESSYAQLTKKDKSKVAEEASPLGEQVHFTGFDGNHEGELIGIASFLIEKMERFTEFEGRKLNSHMPTIPSYKRMLAVFGPMSEKLLGGNLNANQVVAILKAWGR